MGIPFQYIKNKQTGKIKQAGFVDLSSDYDSNKYEHVIGRPAGEVDYEKPYTLQTLIEEIRAIWMSQPVDFRLKYAQEFSMVTPALKETQDFELVNAIVAQVPNEEGLKTLMQAAINKYLGVDS